MTVDPGEMRAEISIIRRDVSINGNGYPSFTDTVVRTCRAKFSQTSGTEIIKSNADFAELKVRFLVRWTSTPIERRMLVKYSDAEYEIKYINSYGDSKKYVELWCELLTQKG